MCLDQFHSLFRACDTRGLPDCKHGVGLLLQGQGFLPVRVRIVAAKALVNPARRGSGWLPDVLASQELPWLSRWQRLQGGLPFGQRDGVLQAAGGGVPAPGMVAGVQLCQPR